MQNRTGKTTEQLVDEMLKALEEANQIEEIEFHKRPDDDCFLANFILAKKYPELMTAKLVLTSSGNSKEKSQGSNSNRITVDIGGGIYDHHGKGLGHKTSADLIAEKIGLSKDPGLKTLLEIVRKVDNAEKLSYDSIHYIIEGLPCRCRKNGDVDWTTVRDKVFELFESVYLQDAQRDYNEKALNKHAIWITLPNGLKICKVLWRPEFRDVAFEAGASVVLWTRLRGPGAFWVGLSVNRNLEKLCLNRVAEELRRAEAKKREISTDGLDLRLPGEIKEIPGWYLGDNFRFLLYGSRTNPIPGEKCTKLTPTEIQSIIEKTLSFIPLKIVDSWKNWKK